MALGRAWRLLVNRSSDPTYLSYKSIFLSCPQAGATVVNQAKLLRVLFDFLVTGQNDAMHISPVEHLEGHVAAVSLLQRQREPQAGQAVNNRRLVEVTHVNRP